MGWIPMTPAIPNYPSPFGCADLSRITSLLESILFVQSQAQLLLPKLGGITADIFLRMLLAMPLLLFVWL